MKFSISWTKHYVLRNPSTGEKTHQPCCKTSYSAKIATTSRQPNWARRSTTTSSLSSRPDATTNSTTKSTPSSTASTKLKSDSRRLSRRRTKCTASTTSAWTKFSTGAPPTAQSSTWTSSKTTPITNSWKCTPRKSRGGQNRIMKLRGDLSVWIIIIIISSHEGEPVLQAGNCRKGPWTFRRARSWLVPRHWWNWLGKIVIIIWGGLWVAMYWLLTSLSE